MKYLLHMLLLPILVFGMDISSGNNESNPSVASSSGISSYGTNNKPGSSSVVSSSGRSNYGTNNRPGSSSVVSSSGRSSYGTNNKPGTPSVISSSGRSSYGTNNKPGTPSVISSSGRSSYGTNNKPGNPSVISSSGRSSYGKKKNSSSMFNSGRTIMSALSEEDEEPPLSIKCITTRIDPDDRGKELYDAMENAGIKHGCHNEMKKGTKLVSPNGKVFAIIKNGKFIVSSDNQKDIEWFMDVPGCDVIGINEEGDYVYANMGSPELSHTIIGNTIVFDAEHSALYLNNNAQLVLIDNSGKSYVIYDNQKNKVKLDLNNECYNANTLYPGDTLIGMLGIYKMTFEKTGKITVTKNDQKISHNICNRTPNVPNCNGFGKLRLSDNGSLEGVNDKGEVTWSSNTKNAQCIYIDDKGLLQISYNGMITWFWDLSNSEIQYHPPKLYYLTNAFNVNDLSSTQINFIQNDLENLGIVYDEDRNIIHFDEEYSSSYKIFLSNFEVIRYQDNILTIMDTEGNIRFDNTEIGYLCPITITPSQKRTIGKENLQFCTSSVERFTDKYHIYIEENMITLNDENNNKYQIQDDLKEENIYYMSNSKLYTINIYGIASVLKMKNIKIDNMVLYLCRKGVFEGPAALNINRFLSSSSGKDKLYYNNEFRRWFWESDTLNGLSPFRGTILSINDFTEDKRVAYISIDDGYIQMYDVDNKIISSHNDYMMSNEKIDPSIPDHMLSPLQRTNRLEKDPIQQVSVQQIPIQQPSYKYIKYLHDKKFCIGYNEIENEKRLYVKRCEEGKYMFDYVDKKIILKDDSRYCISYNDDNIVIISECSNAKQWIIKDNNIIFDSDKRFCLDLNKNSINIGSEIRLYPIKQKFTQEVEFTSNIDIQFPSIESNGKCDISNGEHIISEDGNWKLSIVGFGDPVKYHKENGKWKEHARNGGIFQEFNIMKYGGPKDRKCPYKLLVSGIGMCIHNRDDNCMWNIHQESGDKTGKLLITNTGEIRFTLSNSDGSEYKVWQDGRWIR